MTVKMVGQSEGQSEGQKMKPAERRSKTVEHWGEEQLGPYL